MLGLMMAMVVLQGAVSSNIAIFVSDLDHDVRKKILGLFQSEQHISSPILMSVDGLLSTPHRYKPILSDWQNIYAHRR